MKSEREIARELNQYFEDNGIDKTAAEYSGVVVVLSTPNSLKPYSADDFIESAFLSFPNDLQTTLTFERMSKNRRAVKHLRLPKHSRSMRTGKRRKGK